MTIHQLIIKHVLSEIKTRKIDVHSLHTCAIIKDVLKKYGQEFFIKRGYLNVDGFGRPICFTYFWLEDIHGTKLDPLKRKEFMGTPYFFSDRILAGVECIDKCEPQIAQKTNMLWKKLNTDKFYDTKTRNVKGSILKKHPDIRISVQ